MKARWVCATCERARRSAFCEDCGASAPVDDVCDAAKMSDLRSLHARLGSRHQSHFNSSNSFAERGYELDRQGWSRGNEASAASHLKRALQFKQDAEAVSWAILKLESSS